MTLHLGNGNNPSKLYAGNQEVQKVYHGSTEVWSNAVVPVGGGTASINIVRRSVSGVAPEAFVFEVDLVGFDSTAPTGGATYDNRFHDVYYHWTFDDSYNYTAPINLASTFLNANKAYGPIVSHTYRQAGTYTVTCTATEPSSGKTAVATLDVTIANPSTLFSGTNTIFVDPNSEWGNAPSGSQQVTSISAALSAAKGQQTTPKRIMLNRGKTYSFSGTGFGNNSGSQVPSALHIVAGPGGGAKPKLNCTGAFLWADNTTTGNGKDKDLVIQDLNMTGRWDPTTESGSHINGIEVFANSPNLLLVDGCTFTNFNMGIYVTNTGGEVIHRCVVVNDTTIHGWRDYGMQAGHYVAFAVTGSSIRQNADALAGGPKDGTHNTHNPYRQGVGDRVLFHSCELFSRNGWPPSNPSQYQSIQPCLRLNQSAQRGAKYNIQGCYFEGGDAVIAFSTQGGFNPTAINAVLEKNYILGTMQSGPLISSDHGGVTIRNNTLVMADISFVTAINPGQFIQWGNCWDADAIASPQKAYNNTCINLMQDANYRSGNVAVLGIVSGTNNFTTTVEANNINYQPNVTNGPTSDGPLADSTNQWIPYSKGYFDDTDTVPEEACPVTKIPTTSAGNFTPGSTLFASGGATAKVVKSFSNYVYVYGLTSSISNGESLTESPGSGASTCNGGSEDTGVTASYATLTGSPARNSATGVTAYDDFYGTVRGANPDRGAIEA